MLPQHSQRTAERSRRTAVALVAIALLASPAWAYVDPGIVATLYQLAYVIMFGALTALVFKPIRFIKTSFQRLRERLGRTKAT